MPFPYRLFAVMIPLPLVLACVADDENPQANLPGGGADGAIASVACKHADQPDTQCGEDESLSPTVDVRGCIIAWSCRAPSTESTSSLSCPDNTPPECESDQAIVEIEDSNGCSSSICEDITPCTPGSLLLEGTFDLSTQTRRNLADAVCDDIEELCTSGSIFQSSEDPEAGTLHCACACGDN